MAPVRSSTALHHVRMMTKKAVATVRERKRMARKGNPECNSPEVPDKSKMVETVSRSILTPFLPCRRRITDHSMKVRSRCRNDNSTAEQDTPEYSGVIFFYILIIVDHFFPQAGKLWEFCFKYSEGLA